MCDIVDIKCKSENCALTFNIHLADFDTSRDEIEIYCKRHFPKHRKDGVVWKYREGKSCGRFFMRALTRNAKKRWRGNCYNGDCEAIEIFGKEE